MFNKFKNKPKAKPTMVTFEHYVAELHLNDGTCATIDCGYIDAHSVKVFYPKYDIPTFLTSLVLERKYFWDIKKGNDIYYPIFSIASIKWINQDNIIAEVPYYDVNQVYYAESEVKSLLTKE